MFGKNKKSVQHTLAAHIVMIDGEPYLVETTPFPQAVVETEAQPAAEKTPKRAHRAARSFPRPHLPKRPNKAA